MESNKLFPKDIFQQIGNVADDKTVLQLIFLNKEKYGEDYIKKVLESRYPYLLKYKREGESYRMFYARNIYYIAKLKEDYNFQYTKEYSVNPPQYVYYAVKAHKIFVNLPKPRDGKYSVYFLQTKNNEVDYEIIRYWNEFEYTETVYNTRNHKNIFEGLISEDFKDSKISYMLKNYEIEHISVYSNEKEIYKPLSPY